MAETFSQRMRHQLARFLVVGAAGFAVDVGVMASLFYGFGFGAGSGGLVGCRLVAFLAAVSTTFLLNARFTFGASVRRAKLTHYLLIQTLGAAINIGTYVVLVLGPLPRPLLALAIGSAVATVSNFFLVRRYVYDWR
jgi:putative flippase GtrA